MRSRVWRVLLGLVLVAGCAEPVLATRYGAAGS
jgi:hypothetical protein